MKKIGLVFGVLVGVICACVMRSEAVPVSVLGSPTISKNNQFVCSSTTATILLSANSARKGMAVFNGSAYTVRLSTYASTSRSVGYSIPTNQSFADNIEAYTGAWYGLTSSGDNVTSTVDVIEKTGVNY
jgi:hypothetical protein